MTPRWLERHGGAPHEKLREVLVTQGRHRTVAPVPATTLVKISEMKDACFSAMAATT
jgi:hypothetical protein